MGSPNAASGNGTISLWSSTVAVPPRSPLRNDARADVCVVGAGIAGLTTAYMLAREGRSVVVLDDGEIGGGETHRTTAHLVNALDDRYFRLEELHGADGARLAAESHSRAIDEIERIVRTEDIACEFERVDGYLFTPPEGDSSVLDRELDAVHRAGLAQVERRAGKALGPFDLGPCLRFPRQARFDPMKFLVGLASAIEAAGGGRIHTQTHVSRIEGGKDAFVETGDGRKVRAGAIVVATNSPIVDRVAVHTKQAAYRTYVVAMRVPAGTVDRALYWDTADPYHYLRTHTVEEEELLIIGGEDHKTGQDGEGAQPFARLAKWTRERIPAAQEIAYQWSGQVMEPVDGLAFIGRDRGAAGNVYVATGDSGNGMTHGTIAGVLLADLIAGRPNHWTSLYDPSRVTLRSAVAFAKENLNVAAQYAEHIGPADIESVDELAAGHGAIMRRGLRMIATYRDEQGALHERSAICPHLGCIVAWNDVEHTWDCPCHGSRFAALGKVINGPANVGLRVIDESTAGKDDKACGGVRADADRR